MKLLITLSVLLSATLAQAAPQSFPEQAPLRQAHVKGTIKKYLVKNRTFADPGELVCEIDTAIPVYASPEEGKVLRNPVVADCSATANGQPQKVQLLGSIDLSNAHGERPALKNLSVIFLNYGTGEQAGEFLVQMGASATDQTASALGLRLYAPSFETNLRSDTTHNFVVDLTVSDDEQ